MKRDDETESAAASTAEARASAARSDSSANPLAAPRYEILGEHGRGGLGRVSRARDRQLGRDVAIKELIARDAVSDARFRREAMITAKLENPGIVPVHEAGQWADGTPYYAMKLVSGRPLSALIAARATVAERIGLLHHVIAVADAIAYAHGQGVIHRDLKPSNVIVGDFGETVVIDWGLAKELSASSTTSAASDDASVVSPDIVDASSNDALTKAGAVLGTPAYMPPEQARGESVDQRADVFAIGAMLWELCALTKVPPSDRRQRDRLLRSNGIDSDLIAILDKCLDRAASRRYADGAALAADLRAFKAGARISARQYSLPAVLSHWARRHRSIAIVATAVLVATVIGIVLYARDLAAERRRVDAGAQALILENARVMMVRDPTSAYELLEAYQGNDKASVEALRAEARGRGVAFWRMHPQSAVLWMFTVDRNLFAIHFDGTLSRLLPNGLSYRLDALPILYDSYELSYRYGVLVYRCEVTTICMYNVRSERQLPFGVALNIGKFVDMSISPDGSTLSLLTKQGLTCYSLSAHGLAYKLAEIDMEDGDRLLATSSSTLWVSRKRDVVVLHLDSPRISYIPISGLLGIRVNGQINQGLVTAKTGEAWIVSLQNESILARFETCPQEFSWARLLNDGDQVAYVCGNGVWVWDRVKDTRRMVAVSYIQLVQPDNNSQILYWSTLDGSIMSYDAVSRSIRRVVQQAAVSVLLLAPSRVAPYLISYTVDTVRVWALDRRVDREFDIPPTPWTGMLSLSNGGMAIPRPDGLAWVDKVGSYRQVSDSYPYVSVLFAPAPLSTGLAAIERDDVAVWLTENMRDTWLRLQTGGRVLAVYFSQDERYLTVLYRDGRLSRWDIKSRTSWPVTKIPSSLVDFRSCPGIDRAVVIDQAGNLWVLEGDRLRAFGKAIGTGIALVCSRGGEWAASVTSDHDVRVVNINTHQRLIAHTDASAVLSVAFSPDANELAIATPGKVFIRKLAAAGEIVASEELESAQRWTEISIMNPQWVAYAPDGKWLAITGDHGAVWFYDRISDRWDFVPVGTETVFRGLFTSDSERFFAKNTAGKGYIIDMKSPQFAAPAREAN